jgi:hypothetical protein
MAYPPNTRVRVRRYPENTGVVISHLEDTDRWEHFKQICHSNGNNPNLSSYVRWDEGNPRETFILDVMIKEVK